MSVLQRLELIGDLTGALIEPAAIEIRDALSGQRLATIPLGTAARDRYGAPYCLIHRAALQAGLLAALRQEPSIALHVGAEVADIRVTEGGVGFRERGNRREADLLVAADGIRSRIRADFFGYPPERPLGYAAWRAMLQASAIPDRIPRDTTGLWLGAHGHVVHYPIAPDGRLNIVVIAAAPAAPTPPREPFGREVRRLLDAVSDWASAPLADVDPQLRWTKGRVVLIGDAAHAMAPSAAQGGAQAIEDAWVLASKLAGHKDCEAALTAFERERRPRVERIARTARRNLLIYGLSGISALARNAALRSLPASLLLSGVDSTFDWKPTEKNP
jgi:salicylate hydroxylase